MQRCSGVPLGSFVDVTATSHLGSQIFKKQFWTFIGILTENCCNLKVSNWISTKFGE